MRVLRVTRNLIPGSTSQIGVLCVILQRSVSLALPKSQQPIDRDLLDGAIICIGRTGTAVTDNRSRMSDVCRVREEIPSVIIRTVINGECLLWTRSPLQTCRAGTGVQHGKVDVGAGRVGANHEFR